MSNVIIKPKGSSMFEVRDGGPEGRLVRKFTTELEAARNNERPDAQETPSGARPDRRPAIRQGRDPALAHWSLSYPVKTASLECLPQHGLDSNIVARAGRPDAVDDIGGQPQANVDFGRGKPRAATLAF